MPCSFVPPFLLRHLAEADPGLRSGSGTLDLDRRVRERRAGAPVPVAPSPDSARWSVHDAAHGERLPGRLVRPEGSAVSGDAAVDEAAYGINASLDLLAQVFGRRSFDDAGAPVVVTVHFGRDYDNAFWDGTQLVFGDGDGEVFDRFTKPVDVLGHELAHAVTEYTAGLEYAGQPGALNESVSDVVACCLKQWLAGERVEEADWLIGEGIFLPGVQARALRDMAHPGTAYDDPRLGVDPQVGHLRDYVDTEDDNGGVHLNSGIPNRAFVLAARAIGGTTWEGAGQVWYDALVGGEVGPATDFAGFAAATVAAAGDHAEAVRRAWAVVGVEPGASAPVSPTGEVADTVVAVRRTGGVAGVTVAGQVDLAGDDPRAEEVRVLAARVDLRISEDLDPAPDRFVYVFELRGEVVRVPERQLTDELRRLAALVLGRP